MTYDAGTRRASLLPDVDLEPLQRTYTATVSGVEDVRGQRHGRPRHLDLHDGRSPLPPPDEGPGGPILVIADAANPFGRYYAEILRCEGLNAFTATDICLVDAGVLAAYDVVILGEMALSGAQVTLLTDWVNAGGNLIAMRPDAQLAGLLGLTSAAAHRSPTATCWSTRPAAPGVGIVGETIQFHGSADLYTLTGATALATLYCDATTATAQSRRDPAGRGAAAAARRRPSPTTWRARSSTRARATRPGRARSATACRRCAPTTCSTAGGDAARLGRPGQGRDPPGRRAAAAAGQPDPGDERRPQAAAALLVLPARPSRPWSS